MTLNLDGLASILWTQLWQVTLLIPLAIGLVRWGCRGRSHLGYVVLLAVLVKCIVPPVWSSPTGMFSWASHAMGLGADSPAVSADAPRPAVESVAIPSIADSDALDPQVKSSRAANAQGPGLTSENPIPPPPVPPTLTPPVIAQSTPAEENVAPDWTQIGLAALLGSWICGIVGVIGYLLARRVFRERFHGHSGEDDRPLYPLLARRVFLERFHDDTRVATQDDLLSIVSECAIALDLRRRPDLVVTTHPTIPFVVGW